MPMASGNKLVIAPESDQQRMTIENLKGNKLQLIDGRGKHNNGWFVVRSLVQKGATKNAIEWLITPHAIEALRNPRLLCRCRKLVITPIKKIAVIELMQKDAKLIKCISCSH